MASELFTAKVKVTPRPAEFDMSRVSTDPRRARYVDKKSRFGPPFGHLCKMVSLYCIIIIINSIISPAKAHFVFPIDAFSRSELTPNKLAIVIKRELSKELLL